MMEKEIAEQIATPRSRRELLIGAAKVAISERIDGGIAGVVMRNLTKETSPTPSEAILPYAEKTQDFDADAGIPDILDDELVQSVEVDSDGILFLKALLEETIDGEEIDPINVAQAIGQVLRDRGVIFYSNDSEHYANCIVPIGSSKIYLSHYSDDTDSLKENAFIEFRPDGEFEGATVAAIYSDEDAYRLNHNILQGAKADAFWNLTDSGKDDVSDALTNGGFSRVKHVPFLTAALEGLTLGEKSTFAPEMIKACDFPSMEACALDWYENTFIPELELQEDLRPSDTPIEPEIDSSRTHFLNALKTRAAILSASPSFDADAPEIRPSQNLDQLIDKIEQQFGLASRIGNALPVIGTAIEVGRAIIDANIPAENLELAMPEMLRIDGEEQVVFESKPEMIELGQES